MPDSHPTFTPHRTRSHAVKSKHLPAPTPPPGALDDDLDLTPVRGVEVGPEILGPSAPPLTDVSRRRDRRSRAKKKAQAADEEAQQQFRVAVLAGLAISLMLVFHFGVRPLLIPPARATDGEVTTGSPYLVAPVAEATDWQPADAGIGFGGDQPYQAPRRQRVKRGRSLGDGRGGLRPGAVLVAVEHPNGSIEFLPGDDPRAASTLAADPRLDSDSERLSEQSQYESTSFPSDNSASRDLSLPGGR